MGAVAFVAAVAVGVMGGPEETPENGRFEMTPLPHSYPLPLPLVLQLLLLPK